ncbi:hypothetical protein CDD83_8945 [Cordyceps sp. RAO-2017]|nr:hypothetical protein CDD83_8945 [Cordyceps sp. RAO-2017]
MAELSSNWKRLQAKIKGEGTSAASSKRKTIGGPNASAKKRKFTSNKDATAAASRQPNNRPAGQQLTMGGVHSSTAKEELGDGVSPSLALWAKDNNISAETLAEAYGLGLRVNSATLESQNDRVNHGLSAGIEMGKYMAIDCEMVGVGPGGYESALARVSLVDFHGKQIYDSFVKQRERVTDWRTAVSGVSQKEMRFARDFQEVQEQVADILKDRVLVGHDVKHDLAALKLSHPARDTRDTAKYAGFRRFGHGRKPALRVLAKQLLGVEIQGGPHSSIEDARVTMLLFRKHKPGFDVDHANRYAPKPCYSSQTPKKKQSGRKKGRN